MYRKILVAYNGTPESRCALHECIRLAPDASVEIHLLVIIHVAMHLLVGELAEAALGAEENRMEQELAVGHALMASAGVNAIDHLEVGEPVNVIGDLVKELGIDLVIVGHSHRKPLALRWWQDSLDALLLDRLHCSLLIAAEPGGRPAPHR